MTNKLVLLTIFLIIAGYAFPMLVLYNTEISIDVEQGDTKYLLHTIFAPLWMILFPIFIFDLEVVNASEYPVYTMLAGYSSFIFLLLSALINTYLVFVGDWFNKMLSLVLLLFSCVPLAFYIGPFLNVV